MIIPLAKYKKPSCNHLYADETNYGYTVGLTSKGVPYEAELFDSDGDINFHIVLPFLSDLYVEHDVRKNSFIENKVKPFVSRTTVKNNAVLTIGMIEDSDSFSDKTLWNCVDYLEEEGLVQFTSNHRNGYMYSLFDFDGNRVVAVNVTLRSDDFLWAYIGMDMMPYEENLSLKTYVKRPSRKVFYCELEHRLKISKYRMLRTSIIKEKLACNSFNIDQEYAKMADIISNQDLESLYLQVINNMK